MEFVSPFHLMDSLLIKRNTRIPGIEIKDVLIVRQGAIIKTDLFAFTSAIISPLEMKFYLLITAGPNLA